MASIVFLKGVNVGGNRKFQPSLFAKELADLQVVSIGAAGTFVVRAPIRESLLRAAFEKKLPFQTELFICPAAEILELVSKNPFGSGPVEKGVKRSLTVLLKKPKKGPRLPILHPTDGKWEVQINSLSGRYATSLRRRLGSKFYYPNEVVEKNTGLPATTRDWNTVIKICGILGS